MHLLKKWFLSPVESILLQVPRALVASIIATSVDFAVLVLLVELGGWSPTLAAVVGYLVGGVIQYILAVNWVFPTAPTNHAIGFATCTLLSMVGLVMTWLVIAGFEMLGWPYTLGKLFSLGLTFWWNFFTRKYLVFPESAPGTQAATFSDQQQPELAQSGEV